MKNRFRGLSESRKLEMLQMSVEEIYDAGYVTGYTNGAFNKLQNQSAEVKPKSPNQRRAELIQRAKVHVGEQFDCWFNDRLCSKKFIINPKKRTVLLLLISKRDGSIRAKGIAKCHPDEVFNADIGKAIALARALEIEIPQEFMDAVQPDVKVVGMILKSGKEFPEALFGPFEKGREFKLVENLKKLESECLIGSPIEESATITDDTHVEYEVSSC